MKEYTLKWTVEPRDVHVLTLKRNISFWICTLFFSVLSAILIWDAFFLSFSRFVQVVFFCLSMGFSSFLFYWYIAAIQKLNLKRRSELLGTMQLTINQSGIGTGDEENYFMIPWERVRKMEEFRGYLLIKTEKKEKLLIPKRCFATSEEAEEVRLFIKNSIQR